ncbi:hypothetical protein ACLKA7_011451 [Drosophila subpalustris]
MWMPTPTLTDCPLGKLGGRHGHHGRHCHTQPTTACVVALAATDPAGNWPKPHSQTWSLVYRLSSIVGCVSVPRVQNEIDIECATTENCVCRRVVLGGWPFPFNCG